MPDLICYIPNHGYSDETQVYVSWLDGNYFVEDPTANSFKLEESVDGVVVQYTENITSGYVREVDAGELTSTITGLEHLEAEEVKVTSDGRVVLTDTVLNGEVTLPGNEIETYAAGKNYEATLTPMDLDIGDIGLTTTKRINRAFVDFYNTIGGQVGTNANNMENVSDADELFTGFKKVPIPGGYSRDTDITVKQPDPLPMTVLSIGYDLGASND
jgi:hypothetical protein